LRQIDEEYIQNGQVRFGYIHMAFLSDASVWAAEATECAGDQGRFWDYHDLLYSRQGEAHGNMDKALLKDWAVELGLDAEAFNACLDSGKYTQLVQEQTSFAQSLGIQGTPAFVVAGQPVVGAQPFETFKSIIDQSLSALGE